MEVTVKLFAMLRQSAGVGEIAVDLADQATVADALAALRQKPGLGEMLTKMPVRMAVNRDYADESTRLDPGDELALIPPVSGGEEPHVQVSSAPLDPGAVTALVGRPGAGAVITFCGTTRDVDRLDYEAYADMATEKMGSILAECIERHGLEAAAAEHRVGSVGLGEPSVVVAVSAAHREEAFAGAREAIDRIKAEAPIWKLEVDGERENWVEGTVPE